MKLEVEPGNMIFMIFDLEFPLGAQRSGEKFSPLSGFMLVTCGDGQSKPISNPRVSRISVKTRL